MAGQVGDGTHRQGDRRLPCFVYDADGAPGRVVQVVQAVVDSCVAKIIFAPENKEFRYLVSLLVFPVS